MMKRKDILRIIITFFLSQMVIFTNFAQSKYEINAHDFTIYSLTFGTSFYEFQERFPIYRAVESYANGTHSYMVEFPSSSPNKIIVTFYKDKIYNFLLSYRGLTTVKKSQNFAQSILEKFGYNPVRFDESDTKGYVWNFPKVNRRIGMSPGQYDDEVILVIEDTKAAEKRLKERDDKVNLGF